MSKSVTASFVADYQDGVHVAYQRTGSKLRNTVRTRNNITGAIAIFQKIGKGKASSKSRHGKVPVMNIDHSTVECTLSDHYAADWVDKLDLPKLEHDEKLVLQQAGAYALGRKTDEIILTELAKSTNYALDGTTGMTKDKVLLAMELLGDASVPDDGDRYGIVGWRQWGQMLDIPEFKDADYIGTDDLPWKAAPSQAKKWLGTIWMPMDDLPKAAGVRSCFWYHKNCIGHAIGAEISADITWQGTHAAWFINNMMSQGAVLIDPAGVVSLRCLES